MKRTVGFLEDGVASKEGAPNRITIHRRVQGSCAQRLPKRRHIESQRRKEGGVIPASQEQSWSTSCQPPMKGSNAVIDKEKPTCLFDLPRELRQSVLHMTYSDSVFKHRNYTDFLSADADSSDFSYSHNGCILAHADWIEDIKGMHAWIAEDMDYVEGQWKKKYILLNAPYIKQRNHSIKTAIRKRYTEMVLRGWREPNRQRHYLRSRSFLGVHSRALELLYLELNELSSRKN